MGSPSALRPGQKAPWSPRPVHQAVPQHPDLAGQEAPLLTLSKVELLVSPRPSRPAPNPAVSLFHEMALRSTAAPIRTSQLTFPFPPSPNLFHQPDLSGPLSRYICVLCAAPASSLISLLHSPAPAFRSSSHSQRGPEKTKMGPWTPPP